MGERTKADPEYNGRMTFANSGPKNLALSGEEKATTEPNGGPMLRPSPCSGPIQADYDYDYWYFVIESVNHLQLSVSRSWALTLPNLNKYVNVPNANDVPQ